MEAGLLLQRSARLHQYRGGKGDGTGAWELYDLEADRVELDDRSAAEPALRDKLIEDYGRFSERAGVSDWEKIQRDLERLYRE